MTTGSIAGFLPGTSLSANRPANTRESIAAATEEFESLLLGQLLKNMRESASGSWLGGEGDESGAVLFEMAEQQFARLMAAQGGLGLAKLAASGLEKPESRGIAQESPKIADKGILNEQQDRNSEER